MKKPDDNTMQPPLARTAALNVTHHKIEWS